jgi:peptidyl-prolyl cis-trans isomerase C
MKLSRSLATAILGLVLLSTGAVTLADDNRITVNGKVIPAARFDAIYKNFLERGTKDSPELRQAIRDLLIRMELISQEAAKKGLDRDPDVVAQMESAKQEILGNAYLQKIVKANPVTEDMIKQEYERRKALHGDKEYKVRHILVRTEEEAKDIIARLAKGGKFDALAKEKSDDPGSKDKGGDLGWVTRATVVKPFSDAMVKLQKGRYTTTPVQSQFGWHVIKLDDTRALKIPPYDEAKKAIREDLVQMQLESAVAELRAKAKIEVPGN